MSNLNIGDKAIDFKLPAVDGSTRALSDYADKDVVAVFFTCNHCPYVLAWEDRIIALQDEFAGKNVQFVAVGSNDATKKPADSFPKMKEHAEEKGFNFPYLHDESQEIAQAYGAERTPEFFVFDKDRKLVYHGKVDDNYEDPGAVKEQYLRDALNAIVSNDAPPVATTDPVGCTIKWKD